MKRSRGELPRASNRGRDVLAILALAILYTAAAKLGLALDAVSGFATLVWPPTGLSLAALLLFGTGLWPGVAIGAFVANLWTGAPVPVALGIAAGNTLEAVFGVWLLRRARVSGLERLADVFALIVLAALGSTLVSATIGVGSLSLGGVVPAGRVAETWRAWWVGDALGNLVFAPLLLSWLKPGPLLPGRRRAPEIAALATATLAVGAFVFFGGTLADPSPIRQAYLIFPVLVWAALRFGVRGAATATFVFSALAIGGTALGLGPFVRETLAESLLYLQFFMGAAAATGLVLAAVATERTEALERRESFLAIVSHDLKNPLNVVRLGADGLAREIERWPPERVAHVRRLVGGIERSAERMQGLIRDLLELAAVESGRLALKVAPESMPALVREAVEAVRPLAAGKAQSIELSLPDERLPITCDRSRVLQVLSNVIENAIKYSPAETVISIEATRRDGEVIVSVADQGPGVPAREVRRVFEPFWRGRASDGRSAGLGLAIARGIVESHGGRIWVESAAGRGATFRFALPAAG